MLKVVKYFSLILTPIAAVTCLILFCAHRFFYYGLEAGKSYYFELVELPPASGGVGPTTYEFLADAYLIITVLLAIIIFLQWVVLKNKQIGLGFPWRWVVLFLLVAIFSQFYWVFNIKGLRAEDVVYPTSFDNLLYAAIPFDWLGLCLIVLIFIIEIILLIDRLRLHLISPSRSKTE